MSLSLMQSDTRQSRWILWNSHLMYFESHHLSYLKGGENKTYWMYLYKWKIIKIYVCSCCGVSIKIFLVTNKLWESERREKFYFSSSYARLLCWHNERIFYTFFCIIIYRIRAMYNTRIISHTLHSFFFQVSTTWNSEWITYLVCIL